MACKIMIKPISDFLPVSESIRTYMAKIKLGKSMIFKLSVLFEANVWVKFCTLLAPHTLILVSKPSTIS